jgi:hypothetical protein
LGAELKKAELKKGRIKTIRNYSVLMATYQT